MTTPTNLPQTVSSSYTPTSTVFVFPGYLFCSVVSCIRTMVTPTNLSQTVSSGYTPTSTIFVFQWCSVVSCIRTMVTPINPPQTVSSGYTPTSTIFVFQATNGVQLSAVSGQWLHSHLHLQTCHRQSPEATHLLQLSLFSRLPFAFSCQLYQNNGYTVTYTYRPATDCLQWLHTYFNYLCFPDYQLCSVVSCIRTMVSPANLPQTVFSGPHTYFNNLCFPGYQLCSVLSCIRTIVTPTNLPQSVSSGYTPTSTMLFSRLPVVFSCQLYQDNGYTYKPATDCLQWLHTYFNYLCFPG